MASEKSPRPPVSPNRRDAAPNDLPPSYDDIHNEDHVVPVPTGGNQQRTVVQQQQDGPGAQPPPEYTSTSYGTIDVSESGMDTKAEVGGPYFTRLRGWMASNGS